MTSIPKYSSELAVAVRAARAAARLVRSHAGQLSGRHIWEKGFKDLVTTVDREAENGIIRTLRDAYPEYGVLAEESAENVSAENARWIIDPIDGTVNFAHGLAPFAVSIALEVGRHIQVGVVVDAASGDLFSAIRGWGATRNGTAIRVSSRDQLTECLVATGFPYKDFSSMTPYLQTLSHFMVKTRGVRRLGAASIDLAYVACGLFDGFFEAGLSAWDVAAGSLIVTEAGGHVSDFEGDSGMLYNRQIVASNGRIHNQMLEQVAPLLHAT